MKKLFAMLLITLCLCGLVLTACTGQKTEQTDTGADTTGKPTQNTTAQNGGSGTGEPEKDTEADTDPLYDPDHWTKNY